MKFYLMKKATNQVRKAAFLSNFLDYKITRILENKFESKR
jgi:hypothetical protein